MKAIKRGRANFRTNVHSEELLDRSIVPSPSRFQLTSNVHTYEITNPALEESMSRRRLIPVPSDLDTKKNEKPIPATNADRIHILKR
jgi:hypothetical protein